MGRHGPLTSMALGRSPYDDIIMGEGEGDPRAPLQMYDERGRPVNPETRRINRDIIRSHNEVMLVIGVVEAENSIDEVRAERARHIAHLQHDTRLAHRFEWASRACELAGVWGIAGLRHRILLYREYSHVPVPRLPWHELQQRSLRKLLWDGLPAFVVANAMELPFFGRRIMSSTALKWGFTYIQTMLKAWIFLSRTSLLPASASSWFPGCKYFIPFTSSSIIPPCPLPTALTSRSVASWLGSVGLALAPVLGLWFSEGLVDWVREFFYEVFYDLLPNPSGPELSPVLSNAIVQRATTNADDPAQPQTPPGPVPTLSNAAESLPVRVGGDSDGATPGEANVWEVPQTADAPAPPASDPDAPPRERSQSPPARNSRAGRPDTRRRSSHRPQPFQTADTDDFTDEDEDANEIVSATLISFDVENNPENPDPNDANIPPGVWSAELRPNPGNDSQGGGGGSGGPGDRNGEDRSRRTPRLYRDNALTRLPATLAADMLARRAASLLLAPMEAMMLRYIAESWCRPRGLSTASIGGFSRGVVLNLLAVEIVHFLFDADLWASISMVSNEFVISSAEWEKLQKEEQERQQRQQQQPEERAVGRPENSGVRNEPTG
ncbi:hypothetical protein KVR01_010226 [Diaporthe batatas]|uniref:uncharacterized protein n=1 Tax=Diaporthe batatas TaxID=748121 RepID=UPI001D03D6F0|nr:uncharacterized protein KVR01_010226 [Diaporthe batatas]KAG8159589.1 hypothetical protein KVR01_010226 [Diaporthe batatas]